MEINKITSPQLRALMAVLNKIGITSDDDRHDFIYRLTEGRTNSARELTFMEARQLLSALNYGNLTDDRKLKVIKIIYRLSFEIDCLNKKYDGKKSVEDIAMNKAKINSFCRLHSKAHKNIYEMSLDELNAVKRQFEKMGDKDRNNSGKKLTTKK